jgi:hypothetical protein
LSDFTKPVNLSDFTRAENWSVLPDFTKAANLSDFTRAENWSNLAYPFCPILPSLRTYPMLPGLKTGLIWLVRFVRFYQAANLSDFTRAENWSVLPDSTKAANLSIFTRAENFPVILAFEDIRSH